MHPTQGGRTPRTCSGIDMMNIEVCSSRTEGGANHHIIIEINKTTDEKSVLYRLTLAAQEIFKAVEDIFSEYNEEICRSRKEIQMLRMRLQQAGLQISSETQSCSNEIRVTQTFLEERWRCEEDRKDTEVHLKLEVYTKQEETTVCNESTTLSPCIDSNHDQMASKDIATQFTDSSENDFPFIYQYTQIKNEPGIHAEAGSSCQAQHFIRHSSDDPWESDAYSSNKTIISHIDSATHMTRVFNLPFRNQEMLTQHRMKLGQIKKSQSSVCLDQVSESKKQKADDARTRSRAWRNDLKKDPVKYAKYKALAAARSKEYRQRQTAAAKELDRKKSRERQRRCRARKKLQQCKADNNLVPPPYK